MPNGKAQERLISAVLRKSGVAPGDVGYVEAHGTGTSLGDPIEFRALSNTLGEGHSKENPLLIGSVKTNIGHLESAAGIAGLIKTVLAVRNGKLPPHLHLKNPNPHIPWDESPIRVVTETTEWKAKGARIAGLSSFGISGINAHILVEEPPRPAAAEEEPASDRDRHILVLSAKKEAALRELAERYDGFLARREYALPDICRTASSGRAHFPYRLAVTAKTDSEMRAKLTAFLRGDEAPGLFTGRFRDIDDAPKIGLVLEGVPSGTEGLYGASSVFRAAMDRSARGPEAGKVAVYHALRELLGSWGIRVTAFAGDPLGVACLAGVFSLEDSLALAEGTASESLTPGRPKARVDLGELESAGMDAWRRRVSDSKGPGLPLPEGCDLALSTGGSGAKNGIPQISLSTLDWTRLTDALGELYVRGVPIDWNGFDSDHRRVRVPLPTYPFQRKRFAIERV